MPVIVISGQPGAGSSTVAKLLAKKLKLSHFSVGDWNKRHAKKVRIETEKAIAMWKKKKIGGKSLRQFHFDSDDIARKYARKGNIVIDGKLAVHMTKGLNSLSVWLKAPRKIRAKRYAERAGTTIAEAAKILAEKEELERKNWKEIYGFDYFGQSKEADIVIDTKKKPEEIVGMIIKRLKA